MSKIDDGLREGKLPLPSPRSSSELDERILRAARERAPASRPQRQPWWIAGAATASVLVIAVTMSLTEPPSFDGSEESATVTAVRASAPAQKMKRERSEMLEMSARREMSDHAAAQPAAAARMGVASDSLAEEAVSEYALAPATLAPEAKIARKSAQAAPEFNLSITPQGLSEKLQTLSELVRQGEREQAQLEYEALKKSCPDCDLPEELDQAIAKYTLAE
jgi:hypothetical protein